MPSIDNRDTAAERFRELAQTTEIRTRARLLPRLIRCRDTVADLRRRGADWDTIAGLLKEAGIQIAPGTLRNYQLRIDQAAAHLAARTPGTPPTPDAIYELCRRLARERQPRPHAPAPVLPPAPLHARHRSPDPPGPAVPRASDSLIRDDDLKL